MTHTNQSRKMRTQKNTKDNELQPVNIKQTKTENSVTNSKTSQEYCTSQLSPNSDILDINTEELEQLNETL